jgi:hypothetical protein
MELTERELSERYRQLDSEVLLQYLADGELTDQAAPVARQVLAERGISGTALDEELRRRVPAKPPVKEWSRPKGPVILQSSEILDGVHELKDLQAAKYRRQMIVGAAWAIGGSLFTYLTYQAASSSPGGGTYFIAWGAVGFGVYDFLAGLSGWRRHQRQRQ